MAYTNWGFPLKSSKPNHCSQYAALISRQLGGLWYDNDINTAGNVVCIRNVVVGEPIPEDYNLPSHYTFADNSWGDSFYHMYNYPSEYQDAIARCQNDGARIATPRSDDENLFLQIITQTAIIPDATNLPWFWIGIDDYYEWGRLTNRMSQDPSYTKWATELREPQTSSWSTDTQRVAAIFSRNDGLWRIQPANPNPGYRFICIQDVDIPTEAPTTTTTTTIEALTTTTTITDVPSTVTSASVLPADFLRAVIAKLESVFEDYRPGRGRKHLLNKWTKQIDKFIRRYESIAADGCVFPELHEDGLVDFDSNDSCRVCYETINRTIALN